MNVAVEFSLPEKGDGDDVDIMPMKRVVHTHKDGPKRKRCVVEGKGGSDGGRYSTRSTATVPELSKALCRGEFLFDDN